MRETLDPHEPQPQPLPPAHSTPPPPQHLPSAAPHPPHPRPRVLLPTPPQQHCCGATETCAAAGPRLAPAAAAAARDVRKQIDGSGGPSPQGAALHLQAESPLRSTRRAPAAAWTRSSTPAGARVKRRRGMGLEELQQRATWSLCRTKRAALAASVACSALQCCCTQASSSNAADTSHTNI